MAAFVLIPGAGGVASYWSRVIPLLEQAGHQAVAVDLPGPDATAGLPEYVDLVVAGAGPFPSIVLVAQSLGGFTAPMAAERLSVDELVLVNAMIPLPGETAGEWWDATGSGAAREEAAQLGGYGEFDVASYFLHDVDSAAVGPDDDRPESDAVFESRCDFTAWPEQFGCSQAPTTGSSRWGSRSGSPASDSASSRMSGQAGTSWHCPSPTRSRRT